MTLDQARQRAEKSFKQEERALDGRKAIPGAHSGCFKPPAGRELVPEFVAFS